MNHYAGTIVVGRWSAAPLSPFCSSHDDSPGAQENLMKARDERVALMNEVCRFFSFSAFFFVRQLIAWHRSLEESEC